ncbi:hypothetical protein OIDMADRAFT_180588 [Oidiodendron maius Zn]|uniref:Uncharacterized protein n=1 Tax=Oidiodendron maius (strain Zn) TaxID=913774 RepID=A0A0C3CMV8_OIDMZ|nr:hypothetical protein OIDMADRAFT_180588 [Oidiodendron maius Zn]
MPGLITNNSLEYFYNKVKEGGSLESDTAKLWMAIFNHTREKRGEVVMVTVASGDSEISRHRQHLWNGLNDHHGRNLNSEDEAAKLYKQLTAPSEASAPTSNKLLELAMDELENIDGTSEVRILPFTTMEDGDYLGISEDS